MLEAPHSKRFRRRLPRSPVPPDPPLLHLLPLPPLPPLPLPTPAAPWKGLARGVPSAPASAAFAFTFFSLPMSYSSSYLSGRRLNCF